MNNRIVSRQLIALAFTLSLAAPAMAGVVITGTRVVYPAGEREVMVKIDNKGDKPVLIQSWVDDGDPEATPETAKAPFTITPPVNRVNAGKGQTLRLMFTGEDLPKDKESVFWLSVLEVPPRAKEQKNQLQMAFRSRIKVFYRPQALPGDANIAGESVTWRKVKGGVEAKNPTPYYVSLANIASDKEGKNLVGEGGMIAPNSTQFFPMKNSLSTIYPSYINDYGGIRPTLQQVAP
ncbi:fimbria/pilus periplasmic chaperone [Budviciaceae bacterium BWR-B9]|uniref:Fimbria/pilus periplasmic chaperone n=1 Tax=Limnobaculum allomyrinae TaxID=2791986 RepID=A0ABS1INH3_9GAMM|nr:MULTISPECIES: fimbria/pilus periplasmic chaperone [Limnobaculum]MBK5143112.1 fimbria/pilus periplasmic chaperone [Limnobaculum allomyrinae]MBV7693442.1 fimbria/pilus periplasmic chaperone [Limnobaculum sp. M2-1]